MRPLGSRDVFLFEDSLPDPADPDGALRSATACLLEILTPLLRGRVDSQSPGITSIDVPCEWMMLYHEDFLLCALATYIRRITPGGERVRSWKYFTDALANIAAKNPFTGRSGPRGNWERMAHQMRKPSVRKPNANGLRHLDLPGHPACKNQGRLTNTAIAVAR